MDLANDGTPLGGVPLMLLDAAKAVETSPNGVRLGEIRFRSWQLRRLSPTPPDVAGHAAYLVRVNYEFDIAPDVPAPQWASVGFDFGDPDVIVLDALPRAVSAATGARVYRLTDTLAFAPEGTGGTAVADGLALPALSPQVDCHGIGGSSVMWQHSGTVPQGTHTGWFALLAPPHYDELRVVALGEYHVATDPRLKLRPAGRSDAFRVGLPPDAAGQAQGSPPWPGGTGGDGWTGTSAAGPRVFVSYAQESADHKQAVGDLCTLLGKEQVDVRWDQQDPEVRRIWDEWTNIQILRSDYVIAIASPAYRDVGDGTMPPRRHRGLRSEYVRLADLLHRDRELWTRKLLPVVLPGRSPDELPLSFLPGIGDYYRVDDFTPQGAADLLTVLHHRGPGA